MNFLKSFKNVGHFFATAFLAIAKDSPKVVAGIEKVEATQGTVEAVTAEIPVPQAAAAVELEKAAYAVLGAVASAITAAGKAATAKLADAGLDETAIQAAENAVKAYPSIVAVAKSL